LGTDAVVIVSASYLLFKGVIVTALSAKATTMLGAPDECKTQGRLEILTFAEARDMRFDGV